MSEEHIGYMLAKIPRARFLKVEEVAATIAFALHAPRDAVLTDITVRPGPR